MRVVRAVLDGKTPRPTWSVAPSAVNDLAGRFPEAKLRTPPLLRVPDLDRTADPTGRTRVWLALESLQVTGSFKVRGALTALADAKERLGAGARIVAASAGNHGAGVAYAARALGLAATIVMPADAPEAKRARVLGYGAELVRCPSPYYDDAEAHGRELAARTGALFVSPYEDDLVAAGNGGSLGFEVARALGRKPDILLCPFGGGGLASGLAWALDAPDDPSRRVWGVQSEASPAMALSLTKGAAVTRLEGDAETLAEGLEGGISEAGFARARGSVAGVIVVSESDLGRAMSYGLRELGLVLEGSAATALAPLLLGLPSELPVAHEGQDCVALLTGRNVDRERLLRLPRAGE
jgi:threonine dehydratase